MSIGSFYSYIQDSYFLYIDKVFLCPLFLISIKLKKLRHSNFLFGSNKIQTEISVL